MVVGCFTLVDKTPRNPHFLKGTKNHGSVESPTLNERNRILEIHPFSLNHDYGRKGNLPWVWFSDNKASCHKHQISSLQKWPVGEFLCVCLFMCFCEDCNIITHSHSSPPFLENMFGFVSSWKTAIAVFFVSINFTPKTSHPVADKKWYFPRFSRQACFKQIQLMCFTQGLQNLPLLKFRNRSELLMLKTWRTTWNAQEA